MSSDDKWFKRWGKVMPFGPWSYADVEEMMKEMEKDFMDFKDIEKDIPKELVREKRAEDGSVTKEIGPIVYGYSMTVGPDGKPVVREFGNVRARPRAGNGRRPSPRHVSLSWTWSREKRRSASSRSSQGRRRRTCSIDR